MSLSHRKAFELLTRGMEAQARSITGEAPDASLSTLVLSHLDAGEAGELQAHLADCRECSLDLALNARLRQDLRQRLPAGAQPRKSAGELLEVLQNRQQTGSWAGRMQAPAQLVLVIALLAAVVMVLSWVLSYLRPHPVAVPIEGTPTSSLEGTPQPAFTNTPGLSKIPIQPALPAGVMDFIAWSPDGRFLAFSQAKPSNVEGSDRVYSSLEFYDTQTGKVCQAGDAVLGSAFGRGSLGWLPDGRALAIVQKDVLIFTPCNSGEENITARFGERIQSISAPNPPGNFLVLTGETSYWAFTAAGQEIYPLPGSLQAVSTADHISWSPSGQEVAVSQPGVAGSRISLVNLPGRQVIDQVQVAQGSQQFAAWMDWILPDVFQIYGGPDQSSLLVERQPDGTNRITSIQRDLYKLEGEPPGMVVGEGSFGDVQQDRYHLFLITEQAGQKNIYLYHSDGGRLEKLSFDLDPLLIFPDGQTTFIHGLETPPVPEDLYSLVWVDRADRPMQQLQVQGHSPRQYPQLSYAYDPATGRMLFGSTQGVSYVSADDGRLLQFWSLEGSADSTYTQLYLSPDGKVLAVLASLQGGSQLGPESLLYFIPLPL